MHIRTYLHDCCFNCEGSKPERAGLQCVSRMTLIHHLSPVLILQLKRFSISSYNVTKDDEHVSFPQVLNMTPYCTSECVKVSTFKLIIKIAPLAIQ